MNWDGATWDIISLPDIRGLLEFGTAGVLMSELPAVSPKLWTCMLSGKNAKKTGIDFFGYTSKMVQCKRLWDIFSEAGLTVGVFGSFVTWPPYKVNGFMIPAIDSVGPETYPEDYEFFQEIALNERKKVRKIEGRQFSGLDIVGSVNYFV